MNGGQGVPSELVQVSAVSSLNILELTVSTFVHYNLHTLGAKVEGLSNHDLQLETPFSLGSSQPQLGYSRLNEWWAPLTNPRQPILALPLMWVEQFPGVSRFLFSQI